MQKTINNQGFKTIDLMVLIVLFSLATLVITAIISVNWDNPQKRRAVSDAQSLALQLASGGLTDFQETKEDQGRGPASLTSGSDYKRSMKVFGKQGKIGKDPWGSSFHYDFIEDEENKKLYISVWSDGPNKAKDTSRELIKVHRSEGKNFIVLQGDDLGFVHEIELDGEALGSKSSYHN